MVVVWILANHCLTFGVPISVAMAKENFGWNSETLLSLAWKPNSTLDPPVTHAVKAQSIILEDGSKMLAELCKGRPVR